MSLRPKKKESNGYFSPDYDKRLLEKSYLETFSTRELLVLLRSQDGRENETYHRILKEILATREHLPTKAQSRAIRIEKAKAQKNR